MTFGRAPTWIAATVALGAIACMEPTSSVGALDGRDEVAGSEGPSEASDTLPPRPEDDSEDGGDSSSGDDEEAGALPKFDVGGFPDVGDGCHGEVLELSVLWVTSLDLDTVSKIDTITLQELGRYRTHPLEGAGGDPSRTSVNHNGDVVVAHMRGGGVTKVYANLEDCVDIDGSLSIETSQGPSDVREWGTDECVAWNQPLGDAYIDNRAVAWTEGEFNHDCEWHDADVWTSASAMKPGTIDVFLLDGDTGAIQESVNLDIPLDGLDRGVYGAAVDGDDDVWLSQNGFGGLLVEVSRSDLSYRAFEIPPTLTGFGMTVTDNYVWVCGPHGLGRFDMETETWDTNASSQLRGCMADTRAGLLWAARPSGLSSFDLNTMATVDTITLPPGDGLGMWGVGVDFEGYVWAVPNGGPPIYKVEPDSHQFTAVAGPPQMYTYSDMTGFMLSRARPQG